VAVLTVGVRLTTRGTAKSEEAQKETRDDGYRLDKFFHPTRLSSEEPPVGSVEF
jgi:hypothetical protein